MDRLRTREKQVFVALLAVALGMGLLMISMNGHHPLVSLFVLFPLVASGLLPPPRAAIISLVSLFAASAVLYNVAAFDNRERLNRVIVIILVGALSTWLSSVRVGRENRLRRMTRVAETAQRAIIRAVPTAMGRVSLAARYLSAADDALVGGDLYDVVTTPYGVRLIVGDVRGKGLPAVSLASVVLGAFRFAAVQEPSLADLAQRLDGVVRREAEQSPESEDFVTAVLAEVDDDLSVRYVACGHPYPLIVQKDGAELLEILTETPPLGLCDSTKAEETRWEPGTRVLFYTDGLVEARDGRGRFFSIERDSETLRGADLEGSLNAVVDHVMAHSGGTLEDDLALVLLECR